MNVAGTASAAIAASQAQKSATIATQNIKQNAANEQAVANLVDSASQSATKSSTAAGVGTVVDKSV